jgi:hypothetical protein
MVASRTHRSLALLTALALTASAVAVTGGLKSCTGVPLRVTAGGRRGSQSLEGRECLARGIPRP